MAPLQEVINSSYRRSTKTHFQRSARARMHELVSMGRTCTWLESVSNFLIIRELQSKQLNTAQDGSLLTLHFLPVSEKRQLCTAYSQPWNISRTHLKSPPPAHFSLSLSSSSSSCLHLHTVLQTAHSAFVQMIC